MSLIWGLFVFFAISGGLVGLVAIIGISCGCDVLYFLKPTVWLKSYSGDWLRSRVNIDKNGVLWAPEYPISRQGHVVLNPGGQADGESSHIKEWSYSRPEKEGRIERLNKIHKKVKHV